MPRLVIFAGADPYIARGNVIEVQPTGWFPGSKILQNPRFRIVDVPDEEPLQPLLNLLERDKHEPGKIPPNRKFRVDLDAIEAQAAAEAMTRFGRTISPGDVIDATTAQIMAARVVTPVPQNPRVIG
jgi:hypothetical protein